MRSLLGERTEDTGKKVKFRAQSLLGPGGGGE